MFRHFVTLFVVKGKEKQNAKPVLKKLCRQHTPRSGDVVFVRYRIRIVDVFQEGGTHTQSTYGDDIIERNACNRNDACNGLPGEKQGGHRFKMV